MNGPILIPSLLQAMAVRGVPLLKKGVNGLADAADDTSDEDSPSRPLWEALWEEMRAQYDAQRDARTGAGLSLGSSDMSSMDWKSVRKIWRDSVHKAVTSSVSPMHPMHMTYATLATLIRNPLYAPILPPAATRDNSSVKLPPSSDIHIARVTRAALNMDVLSASDDDEYEEEDSDEDQDQDQDQDRDEEDIIEDPGPGQDADSSIEMDMEMEMETAPANTSFEQEGQGPNDRHAQRSLAPSPQLQQSAGKSKRSAQPTSMETSQTRLPSFAPAPNPAIMNTQVHAAIQADMLRQVNAKLAAQKSTQLTGTGVTNRSQLVFTGSPSTIRSDGVKLVHAMESSRQRYIQAMLEQNALLQRTLRLVAQQQSTLVGMVVAASGVDLEASPSSQTPPPRHPQPQSSQSSQSSQSQSQSQPQTQFQPHGGEDRGTARMDVQSHS